MNVVHRGRMGIATTIALGAALATGLTGVVGVTAPAAQATPAGDTGYAMSIIAGTARAPHPGPATESTIDPMTFDGDVAVDSSGNVYVADTGNGYVEKVTPDGTLSIVAGNGSLGEVPTPGVATDSAVTPGGIAVDVAGNLYVTDRAGYLLKVTPAGALSIIAGNGTYGEPIPGPATNSPTTGGDVAVATDGSLYLTSGPYVVRITAAGLLSIIAGNGTYGAPVPGPATSSPASANAVAVAADGNVYLADNNYYVTKVTPAGVLSIVAGDGTRHELVPGPASSSPIDPSGLAIDASGNLFIADSGLSGSGYVAEVSLGGQLSIIAGGEGLQAAPTPGTATNSAVSPNGLAIDATGALYVLDSYGYVERITTGGILSIIAGTGIQAGTPAPGPALDSFVAPTDVATDTAGNVYIADADGYVEKVTPSGTLTILAGDGTPDEPIAGRATDSPVSPSGLGLDAHGNVYVADTHGYVAKITPGGVLSFVAARDMNSVNDPVDVAVDSSDNLYIADASGYVRKLAPTGAVSIVAGNGTGTPQPGPATQSTLRPTSVAVDLDGNLYISSGWSGYVSRVTPDGQLSNVAGDGDPYHSDPLSPGPATSRHIYPLGIDVDRAGNLYIADVNNYVDKVTPSGDLSIVGGDGTGRWLARPPTGTGGIQPRAVAVGASGELYVADRLTVDKLTPTGVQAPSAPGSPTAPTATGGNGSATLSWATPVDGGSAITDYVVRYSEAFGDTWTQVDTHSTATSTTVSGLENGGNYVFQVAAKNAAGTGQWSPSSAPVMPRAPLTTPGTPGAPIGFAEDSTVVVTWSEPANGGTRITDYLLRYSSTGGSTWTTVDTHDTATISNVAGLANGTAYIFQIAAENSVGTGGWSPSSAAVVPVAPSTGGTGGSPGGGANAGGGTAGAGSGVAAPPTSFTVVAAATPIVTKAKVGKTVAVRAAALSPAAAKVTYQWLRNGKPIKKASRPTYRLAKKDRKKRIQVRISYTRPGLTSLTQTITVVSKVK